MSLRSPVQTLNFACAELNSRVNCMCDVTSESIKFDSFKLNTTLPNLRLKQSDLGSIFYSDVAFHIYAE